MATYELHGRAFEGPLHAPVRNESRSAKAADIVAARSIAAAWAVAGFSVWIYDHSATSPFANASDLRVVDIVRPSAR